MVVTVGEGGSVICTINGEDEGEGGGLGEGWGDDVITEVHVAIMHNT